MSASLSTAPALAGWRIAVIGAVAVLAVGIGVAAGGALLANRTANAGAAAAYVPATAPFYFEFRVEPSADQDAALRELLGRFPATEEIDLDRPLYAQVIEKLDEVLADEAAGVSWSGDVAPWFDGRIGVAVLDIPLEAMQAPADPMTAPAIPSMVVMLGVTDTDAAAASIERILAATENAPTFTEQSHAGVTVNVADGGAYALAADQLLVAPSVDDVVAALDAHASGSTTLAEVAEITRLTDALPSDWLAFGVYDFSDLMAAALSEAASASPAMADAFGPLFENQPLRGAMAFTAGGDRLAIDIVSEPPTGPFAVENADRGLSGEVPADALYYTEAANLGATLTAVIEPMKDAMASVPGADEQIGTMEAALGADLEELVSWIDDGALAVGWDGNEPYGGLVLVPNDMDAAQRRLDQLATFAELAATDSASGLSVEEGEVGSVPVTTIRWEDPNAEPDAMMPAPTGLVVQYALTDDRAIIGFGEAFMGRALELDSADALASVPRFADAVEGMGGSSNTGVAWLDLAGTREAIESAVAPMLGAMGGEEMYESEIRPWLLPLDRVISVTRLEGELWMQRSAILFE